MAGRCVASLYFVALLMCSNAFIPLPPAFSSKDGRGCRQLWGARKAKTLALRARFEDAWPSGPRQRVAGVFADKLWEAGGDVESDKAASDKRSLDDTFKRVSVFCKLRRWLGTDKRKDHMKMYNISETEYGSLRNHHFIQMRAEDIEIDMDRSLGDGSYGMVFRGRFIGDEHKGLEIVAKRAKDWEGRETNDGPLTTTQLEERLMHFEQLGTVGRASADLAMKYLEVEAYMNDLMTQVCAQACAPYLGMALVNHSRWLVWEYIGSDTLEDVLQACHDKGSLKPLARALGVNNGFVDNDVTSLQYVVDRLAVQLLKCCQALEQAGVAHRDIKPLNLLTSGGRVMLIDFGSAAAMGIKGRVGYDWQKCPCDPRYAPPEQCIDEVEWAKYDLYCVGLILVRVLFPVLWDGRQFDLFTDSYHNFKYDLDEWFENSYMLPGMRGVRATMRFKKGAHQAQDQEYIALAEQACRVDQESDLCRMKLGFELLNTHEGPGMCWSLLRSMLDAHPKKRISCTEALIAIKGQETHSESAQQA